MSGSLNQIKGQNTVKVCLHGPRYSNVKNNDSLILELSKIKITLITKYIPMLDPKIEREKTDTSG